MHMEYDKFRQGNKICLIFFFFFNLTIKEEDLILIACRYGF